MNVLVACEESQAVCKEFRKKGERGKQRSKTFPGIAKAMAEQWGNSMSEDEIKDLIQTELSESGYMYTLGMLKGMYKAGAFNVVEWCTLTMYLDDLNMDMLG